jgi:hypothetical protein
MPKRSRAHDAANLEWVGGVLPLAVSIGDVVRPALALWIERSSGAVLASAVGEHSAKAELADEALRSALVQPLVGAPRRPVRVRVSSKELASRIASTVGPDVQVVVGPTPELDEVASEFTTHLDRSSRTAYLRDGTISNALLSAFHSSAASLASKQPWSVLGDRQVMRLDIPTLGVVGGALMLIGQGGMARALLLFPSARDLTMYEMAAVLMAEQPSSQPADIGSSVLSISFEPAHELAFEALQIIERERFALATSDSVPVLEHRDKHGDPLAIGVRDARTALACLAAVERVLDKDAASVKAGRRIEVTLPELAERPELTISYPHQEYERIGAGLRQVAETSRASLRAGRNDPCPCGSGKKFKRCCIGAAMGGPQLVAVNAGANLRGHELDGHLVAQLERFARDELGNRHRHADALFLDPKECIQLLAPISLFTFPVDGMPVAAHFLQRHVARLSVAETQWLTLQLEARLGVWEALEVDPGKSMRVRDLVTGREHLVLEKSGTQNLPRRATLLARIIEHEGVAWMVGCHPRTLMPSQAAIVLEAVRKALPAKQWANARRPAHESGELVLLDPLLVPAWEQAVQAADHAAANRTLHNTDGDPLIFTTDHFAFEPSKRQDLEERIQKMLWCEPPEELPDGSQLFHFVRPDTRTRSRMQPDSTLYGRIVVSAERCLIETNSELRADALRTRLEGICGALVKHRLREHRDPLSVADARELPEEKEDASPPPELLELVREQHARMMQEWLDLSIPALKGKTPREAARTKRGREKVDLLLRDMELMQASSVHELAPDFDGLRTQLGIER